MIVCHSIVTVGGGGGETVRGVEAVREAETVFVRSLIMVYSLASNFFYVSVKCFYVSVKCFYVSVKCFYASVKCFYASVKCFYASVKFFLCFSKVFSKVFSMFL